MISRKAPSLWAFSARGFLSNKKLMAFFIFISLSINGFTPSAAEVSRYSFVMVAATVAKSAVVEIFKKCDVSLTNMAGGFYIDLFSSLESTPMDQSKAGGANKEGSSKNHGTAGDFYVNQTAFCKKNLEDNIGYCYLSSGIISDKLIIDPGTKKSIALCGIIILFLMFIAAILRRKGLDGYIVIKNKEYRKRILGLG